MKKKVLTLLLSTAMVSTVFAGCGSEKTAATSASTGETANKTENSVTSTESTVGGASYEACTLTFDWWGGDSRHEATQKAIEAFEEKYPGIDIEVNFGAWTDWETAKAAEYVSGNNPDVQQTNFDWIGKYDADASTYYDLYSLSDVLDLSQFDDSVLALAEDSKGGLAGIPIALTGRTFYWNKATFEAAGLETPTSLADLLAAGPVFKEKLGDNYYPLVIGEYDRAILMTYYIQAQTGEPIIDEDGNTTVTEEQLEEGLEFIKSLEDAHVIPTEEYILGEGADSMDKSARFINGEYAGIFEWDSSPAKYVAALGDNGENLVVGNLFEDMGEYGTGSYTKVSLMFSISANTEHPTEAALFLNYLLNDEEGVALMGTERGIPESKAAYEVLSASGAIDSLVAEAHKEVMDSNPLYWNPLFDDSSLKGDTGIYTEVFDNFSYGNVSAKDAAEALYAGYTAVAPAK